VSPYWVLPIYVELIRAVWADDGDRNEKSAFCAHETQYLQNKLSKSQQLHQQQCRKRELKIKGP
jgi:hypothetical protein